MTEIFFLIRVVAVTLNPDLWHIIAIHCTLFIHSSSEEEDQNSYVHKELDKTLPGQTVLSTES